MILPDGEGAGEEDVARGRLGARLPLPTADRFLLAAKIISTTQGLGVYS